MDIITRGLAAAALCATTLTAPVAAQDMAGETVTIFVPYREGGGTDTWARFIAARIGEYVGGETDFVIRNVTGGGAIGGGNEYARRAADDGTDLLATAGGLQLPYLLGDERVQYDYADWYPVYASPFGGVVYMRSEDAPADPAELMTREGLRFGSIGATGSDLVPLLAFSLMELDTNVAFGLDGRGPARLSILRGESDLDYQTTSSYLANVQPLVDEGTMTPLFSWGVIGEDGTVERDPTFPDLPSFPEFYETIHGERPQGPGWDAWKAIYAAGFAYQKFVVLPLSAPEPVRTMWRDAFAQMAQDEGYLAEAGEELGLYEQISGDALDAAMETATRMPQAAKDWVAQWLSDTYDVSL